MARRPRAPPMAGGDSDPRAQRQGVQGYDGIDELAKTTVVKPSDLDEKAVKYLDFVQANGGRGNEACTYLKSALEGMSRDHVSNWKAYVYTLLRGFDEEAYKQMKISEGKKVREPRRGAKGDKEKKDKFPVKEFAFNVDAAEFVPSSFKPPQAARAGGGRGRWWRCRHRPCVRRVFRQGRGRSRHQGGRRVRGRGAEEGSRNDNFLTSLRS
ncbi:unnamed protein product [Prorocentrum cordatum]|uniref:Condensin complex subunit 2 n=1 Tax=Prorocentrum cordatum TaxID=2364126 RepID=A0ABN9WJN8_9DINO|nr:unnamed protein product [Polarella glacialis]